MNLGVRDGSYRRVPEETMLEELILFCWPFRRHESAEVHELARRTLARWVDEGLPCEHREGARFFDKCEVQNFFRARRDPVWSDNVASHRRLIGELAPSGASRFDVTLCRHVQLTPARGGRPRRLGILLPLDDAAQTLLSAEVAEVPGVRLARAPGLLEARVPASDARESIDLEVELKLELRPRASDRDASPELDRFLGRAEGIVQVTPFIEALARDLVRDAPAPLDRLARFWSFFFSRMQVGSVHHDFDAADPLRAVLERGWADCYAGSALLVGLCRAADIPARLVSGVLVYPTAPGTHYWLEAWIPPGGWFPLDLACWNLSQGSLADEAFSSRFFGRLDPRIVLERHPGRRVVGLGCDLSRGWYRVETPSGRGAKVAHHDRSTGRLLYSDTITVNDVRPVAGEAGARVSDHDSERLDAIVVGTGWSGSWMAKELTEGGLRVLALDAGLELDAARDLRPHTFSRYARTALGVPRATRTRQLVQQRHGMYHRDNAHLFVDDLDHPYEDAERFTWIRGRQVGGRSLTWGRIAVRISDDELGAASRDGADRDWPIRYADLQPYFDRVEAFLRVEGEPAGVANLPDGPAFHAPEPFTDAERWFQHELEARWPERRVLPVRVVPLDDERGAEWPRACAQGSTLAAAAATGRLTLRAGSIVREVVLDETGRRALGVRVVDAVSLAERTHAAPVIVLCPSTIETARILLHSTMPDGARGICNSSGLVGRRLMDHVQLDLTGTLGFRGPRSARREPLGFFIPPVRRGSPHAGDRASFSVYGAAGRFAPRGWSESAGAFVTLSSCGEMLPRAENRITLHPTRTDRFAIPVPVIACARSAHEERMADDMRTTMIDWVERTGGHVTGVTGPGQPGQVVHEVGTARMGRDPRSSVVDSVGRSWDVPNLFIADGSVWVTGGFQNPTLTMMAIAARTADHIRTSLRRGTP